MGLRPDPLSWQRSRITVYEEIRSDQVLGTQSTSSSGKVDYIPNGERVTMAMAQAAAASH